MSPFHYLQAKMARFVLEFAIIKDKPYYEILAEDAAHVSPDIKSNNESYYLFNISSKFNQEEEKTRWYIKIFRLHNFLATRVRHWIDRKKGIHIQDPDPVQTADDIAQFVYTTIKQDNIDPQKVILKHHNPEQFQMILQTINDKLSHDGLAPIQMNHRTYQFQTIDVQQLVNKPENKDVVLDSIYIAPPKPSSKYVINCAARGRSYLDWIGDMEQDAIATQANVVGFNYRGIGQSSGQLIRQQDIIDDIVAQVKFLINEKKVDPNDITLYGLCLGGAFAALAAAELKKEGIDVKLYFSRSFKRFDQTIIDLVMPRKYDKWPTYIGKILFLPLLLPLSFLFKAYVWSLGWQVNIEKALTTLSPNHVDYDFAEPSKTDNQHGYCGDKIVLSENNAYSVIQDKLSQNAFEQAQRVVDQEKNERLKEYIKQGVKMAFGESVAHWTGEESLATLLEIEKIIQTMEEKVAHPDTSSDELEGLQDEINNYKAVQKGLSFARICCQLAHQVARKNPDEKRWNPHATIGHKLKAYGFEGDQRSRLSWFVNDYSNKPAINTDSQIPVVV